MASGESTPGTTDDATLLHDYAQTRSAEAFGRIVERYIGVVHAAALRQCRGDHHAADDITQVVFFLLSKRARRFGPDVVLSGWLVRATHFTALSHRRAQRRRQRHEVCGAAFHPSEAAMDLPEPQAPPVEAALVCDLWDRIRPLLDEVMARLPRGARDLLTLRFLEGRTYADVGRRFGISEEAARKRAQRGLSSLRVALARRGVKTYEDALEAALGAALAGPVPPALARAVTAGAAASPHHALVLKGAVQLMAWSKTKIAAVGVLAALLTGGAGVAAVRMAASASAAGGMRTIRLPDNGTVTTVHVAPVRLADEAPKPEPAPAPGAATGAVPTTKPADAPRRLSISYDNSLTVSRDGTTWCTRPPLPGWAAGADPGGTNGEPAKDAREWSVRMEGAGARPDRGAVAGTQPSVEALAATVRPADPPATAGRGQSTRGTGK